MTHPTDHGAAAAAAREDIARTLRRYFAGVVGDREDRAHTRAAALLDHYDAAAQRAHAHQLADEIVAASLGECSDLDCSISLCWGNAMRGAADLIRPAQVTE